MINNSEDIYILIPSYNPDKSLITLLNSLLKCITPSKIFIFDDGNKDKTIFKEAERLGVNVFYNSKNKGKGNAIKCGIKSILDKYSPKYILTCDDDLQHDPNDIINIYETAKTSDKKLIIGKRELGKEIPLKSKIGNTFCRTIVNIFYNINIHDTQSGLRAYHHSIFSDILNIRSQRFSFELDVILMLNTDSISEIPIKTIYFNNNEKTRFKPIKDSIDVISSFFK